MTTIASSLTARLTPVAQTIRSTRIMSDVIPLPRTSAPKFQLDPYHRALADAMADHVLERLEAASGYPGTAGRANLEPLLTVEQVAAFFKKDPKTIRRWVKRGLLPGKRMGRSLLFERAVVERGVVEPSAQPDAAARGRAAGAALAARLHTPACG